jgi:4-hydroxythreonine-4-phosphate dehydrogenase
VTARTALTMGDPAGVGPEIVVKLLNGLWQGLAPVVIGDARHLREVSNQLGLGMQVVPLQQVGQARSNGDTIEVLEVGSPLVDVPTGNVDAACGRAAFAYIERAIALAVAGEVDAIVTAPINKASLGLAGIDYPGHTEMLTVLGGAERTAMMLANDELRVVLVTIHCSMREALDLITMDTELATIHLAHEGARQFGIERPRIAVAGLNPHAGEDGRFGREEIDVLQPAIARAQTQGLDVSGPWPGDTVFMRARQGEFDVVVAQYHDQGLIPVKYLGLAQGVNVTLGLPFVRTSPDHGTAFDIAGKGIADPASLHSALTQAHRLLAVRAG